ncbi:MAG: hypothetical protein AAF495_06505 [Pseudomonadota bacterium]
MIDPEDNTGRRGALPLCLAVVILASMAVYLVTSVAFWGDIDKIITYAEKAMKLLG